MPMFYELALGFIHLLGWEGGGIRRHGNWAAGDFVHTHTSMLSVDGATTYNYNIQHDRPDALPINVYWMRRAGGGGG